MRFHTERDLRGSGDRYPSASVVTATGTDGSSVALAALSDASMKLAVDSDGDGITGDTIDTTWELLSAIGRKPGPVGAGAECCHGAAELWRCGRQRRR